MKALSEIFKYEFHASKLLVEQLAKLEGGWPEVERQFDELDRQCIELAGKFNNAKIAGSPTALAIESDLKKARWARDGIRQKFTRERNRLHFELEGLTRSDIQEFSEECLERLKTVAKEFKTIRRGTHRLLEDRGSRGERDISVVSIEDNSDAIEAARTTILRRMHEIRRLQHASLVDLHTAIESARTEFANFRFTDMKKKVVSQSLLDADRHLHIPGPAGDPRVTGLIDRVQKLEKAK